MKDRLRSSQSSRNEETIQKSHYQSPTKGREDLPSDRMSEDMQYKLEKVFEEAGNREERYINLIKEQQEKLAKQSETYLQGLREIKKEFLSFIASTTNNQKEQWKVLRAEEQFSKKSLQKLNSKEFSLKTLKEYSKGQGKTQPELQCKIHCYYFTPFPDDIMRYQLPQNLLLRVGNLYPNVIASKEIKIIKEEDEADNINCLLNRVPFQISTQDNESIVINFKIPCNQDAINHYKRKQFQIELVNKKGMFVFASAKASLKAILNYEDHPTQWQLKPISFYSTLDGTKVGEISIKFGNQLTCIQKNQHFKIQSTTPMQLNNIKSLINYNDDQSRMIQRISKFKTNTNSLLLGIGNSNRQARAQNFFERENDKIILMHRQKKQLESILEYKNTHKSELMDKLFAEAVDKYFLTECEIGCPKFVTFSYHNKERQHRKIFAKLQLSCKSGDNQNGNAASLAIQQNIQTSIVTPKQAKALLRQELVELADESHVDYEFDEQEQSLWAMSGMNHSLLVKVICLPLKPSLSKEANLKWHYQLRLNLIDQYNQQVESFHTKIKIRQPSIENTIHIHGYVQTDSEIEFPFDQEEKVTKKNILTNMPQLQHKWNANQTKLALKVPHQFVGEKIFYLIVNDMDNLYQLGCYQIVIYSYPRLTQSLILQPGQVKKITLDFSIGDDAITEKYQQIESLPPNKAKVGKDQLRILFASSKPEHCTVACENQPQLLCKLNKIYSVEATIQSFDLVTNPEKILIHAVDLDSQKIVKRWLLMLQKDSVQKFKGSYKISCEFNKPMKYKFEFMNEQQKQKTFRFYSSNLSIMTVPMSLVTLITNQRATIELQINVRVVLSAEEGMQPLKVILTVTDGTVFNNYLFEINVRTK